MHNHLMTQLDVFFSVWNPYICFYYQLHCVINAIHLMFHRKRYEKITSFVVKSSERRKGVCSAHFLLYQRDAEVTKHFEDLKWPILLFLVNWRKNIFGCFCPVGERKGCWAILRWKHPAGWQQSSTLGTNNSAPENFPSSLNRQSSQMDFLCSSLST